MKTSIRLALCALALGWPSVRAAEITTGHIAILDNGRVIEGDIERVGDQLRIRRSIGETWLPVAKVQCLCATLEEAYEFQRRQANLQDADERLRLAKWCHLHGLKTQALAEITAAVELRPGHSESRRLLQGMHRAEANPAVAATKVPTEGEVEAGPPPAVEYNADALGMFVTRVQPILMNTCAHCHAGNKGGSFKLSHSYEGELLSRRATQQNLAAVLSMVNREQPQASLLLARAVSVHGAAEQPPLKNRQVPAYRTLEEWVQLAMVNTPRREHGAETRVAPEPPPVAAKVVATPPTTAAETPPPVFAAPLAITEPPPAASQTPADDFDPAIFNRQPR